VGSHVLDRLMAAGHDAAILIRRTADTAFIDRHLDGARVHYGSLEEAESLVALVSDADAVVHCAGATKALRPGDYHRVNADGTRRLVEACEANGKRLRRFVFMSSLAVSGPGTLAEPARESTDPGPVTEYGRSKLAAERHVRRMRRAPFTILRPAAIYGPRDRDFHVAFQAVQRGVAPLISGGRQPLSLVYVIDVAQAVLLLLEGTAGEGGTYHLAHPEPCTQAGFFAAVADCMGAKPLRLILPRPAVYAACALQEIVSRVTRRASIMNLGKIPEYTAPGWVCSTDRARQDLGFDAGTSLRDGVRLAFDWYRANSWL
jgi:nucleoside-diphosphate-sugar epimerase